MKKIKHKVGDEMYVPSAFHISRGSDDVRGGLATIEAIKVSETLPEGHINSIFVDFKEVLSSYNYLSLLERQKELKKQFGKERAHPDPDIDTPWIQDGDYVNGEVYRGPDIW